MSDKTHHIVSCTDFLLQKGKVSSVHAKKTCKGNSGTPPPILNPGTKWR
jgi:hypothetical protein